MLSILRRSGVRRGRGRGLMLALLLCLGSGPLLAQSETTDIKYVEITSIKIKEDGKKRVIEVKAKTPNLPTNCKVQFPLTWRYQTIETYTVPVPANKRIEQAFTVKQYSPSAEHYMFRTQLAELKDQPRAVRQEMEKDTKTFPPGAVPWAEFHEDRKFLLGTEKEIRAEQERIQGWFKDHYLRLAEMDRTVDKAADAVRDGTSPDYLDGKGEFDEKKWRKMMDKDVLEPIAKLQKEFWEGLRGERADLVAYRRPLADLLQLANAVAWRTTEKSIDLYKAQSLDPSPADVEPEEVETAVQGFRRSPPKSKDLGKMVQRINTALGIGKKPEKPETAGGSKKEEGSR